MNTRTRFNRRHFLGFSLGLIGAALLGGTLFYRRKMARIPGSLLGANSALGHRLRGGHMPAPVEVLEQETLIIGGGISGLSAAWWLDLQGYSNFRLLELENETGGNSRSGKNAVSAYPWGAHYVPLPTEDSRYVRLLFEELGVIEGFAANGLPIFNEFYLCSDPHERLFQEGQWHEGHVPMQGLSAGDRRQYDAFFTTMESYKRARGHDGKRAFAIPIEESSADARFRELDRLSMAEFMKENGWNSRGLLWYVNYCCRDDYGAGLEKISAWAGVHYFASRNGKGANAEPQAVLTWPEGNGWLAARIREKLGARISANQLVYSLAQEGGRVLVDVFDATTEKSRRYSTRQVIFAAPRFVAGHVMKEMAENPPAYLQQLHYAPWMVANVRLNALPPLGRGAPLSWDNVSYYSESLGYVVATHQTISRYPSGTVLTFYQPLDKSDPAKSRRDAESKTHQEWAGYVAAELEKMHPGIHASIENIDVWLWGHGMISPPPGFLWGKERKEMQKKAGRVHFAHSDMSGISIFEEAQYRGVKAAEAVMAELGHSGRIG